MSQAQPDNRRRSGLAPGTWSMLPKLVRDCGALKRMRGSQLRVYLALTLRADWNRAGCLIVSIGQLEQETGLCERSVILAVRYLIEARLVRCISRGGGASRANEYQIIGGQDNGHSATEQNSAQPFRVPEENPESPCTLSAQQTLHTSNMKLCTPTSRPLQESNENSERACTPLRTEETSEQQEAHPVADEARQALEKAGVSEPVRSHLLQELPGLPAAVVQQLVGECRTAKNPAGVLVTRLRGDGAELIRKHQAAKAVELQRLASAAEQREAESQQCTLTDPKEILRRGGVPDSELPRLKQAVLTDPAIYLIHRTRWAKSNPHENWGLARAIAMQWEQEHSLAPSAAVG